MGKWCLHASSFIFDRIIIKVAGNQDRHKSLDEFDFGPLVSMAHLYVFEMRFDLGTLDSSERSLPFGLLVSISDANVIHREICVKDFSGTTAPRILKFGTNVGYDLLLCVRENQPPDAYHFLYLSIFLSLQSNLLLQISRFL